MRKQDSAGHIVPLDRFADAGHIAAASSVVGTAVVAEVAEIAEPAAKFFAIAKVAAKVPETERPWARPGLPFVTVQVEKQWFLSNRRQHRPKRPIQERDNLKYA